MKGTSPKIKKGGKKKRKEQNVTTGHTLIKFQTLEAREGSESVTGMKMNRHQISH